MTVPTAPVPPASAGQGEVSEFVQYLFLKVDPAWRRVSARERAAGRSAFAQALSATRDVTWFPYSTLGLKVGAEIMLWWRARDPDTAQQLTSELLCTGLGRYCEIAHSLWGITRPSLYTKRRTGQEQALHEPDRLKYLIVYPFTKTIEWYLMSRDARQGLMNEHMRVGHEYADVRQVLLYATGLDDQEFVVAYETDSLERHHQLVVALRATEARRYTHRDTPIFTAIHRPLDDVLSLVG